MTTTQEFKNDHLTAQVEKLPNCTLRFKVQVEPAHVKELRAKALKTVNKEVTIPGFRPGKAPENLIEKQYGKYIEQEFRQTASQTIVADVIDLSKYYPLKKEGGVSLEKFESKDSGLEMIFHFETFPEVPDVKFDDLKLTPPQKEEVEESEVDRTIKEIQIYHAKWTEVADRPVKEGDFVVIDIDVIDEPAFRAYENSRFHAIEKGMPAWARKLVIGLSQGESAEGMSEKEDNASDAEFIARQCRITVNLIQEAELPEVDDALAKKAGVQTVDELRTNIRKQLERQKENLSQEALREEVRRFLMDNYPFDLPTQDLKNLESDCQQLLERDKGNLKTEDEVKAYKARLFENAQGVVRMAYLMPHLANQLNIAMPSEKETNARMIELLTQHYMKTQVKVPEDQFPYLFNKIQRDLLQEHVLDKMIDINLKRIV